MTNAFHDKHRPKTFDEVVGQEETIESLKHVVEDGRVHSFLFVGPSGTGKTTLARILANELAGGEATAANIEEIPAAYFTGVDSMREVVARSRYKAIGASPVKAIIVDEAHRISKQAWDSLLKPIEEPPAHIYWMFCSTEEGRIPKTIQTRCLKLSLKPVSEDDLLELLMRVIEAEELEVEEEVVEAIVENSGGSPRMALVHLDACQYCETASEALKKIRSAGESKEVIDLCRYLIKGRGRSWKEAMRYLKDLEDMDAESIRIVVVNYFASALKGTTKDKEAARLLRIMECFLEPYNASDKMAPLYFSIGDALDLGFD